MQSVVEGKSVVVIGLGNIGGFAAGLLARQRGLRRLTLVDRDVYDESNLFSQDITAADVGHPKATVQAERLRRINPALCVEAVLDDIEHVPLGALRADVLVACLDSRRARQYRARAPAAAARARPHRSTDDPAATPPG